MSDIHALSGAYAVDALDDVERAGFERHLAECAECRAEVAGLRETAAALADDVALAPPPELRAAVLDGISRVRPLPPEQPAALPEQLVPSPDVTPGHRAEPRTPTRRRWLPALVAAAVLALVGVGAAVWQPWQGDTSVQQTVTDRVLADTDAQRVTQELPNGATATVVRSPSEHRTVVVTEDMPAPPEGKVYQLWLQTPTEDMVDAGLMPIDGDTALLEGDSDDAIGVGLSLEPEGGSDQPTEVVAVFDLQEA